MEFERDSNLLCTITEYTLIYSPNLLSQEFYVTLRLRIIIPNVASEII